MPIPAGTSNYTTPEWKNGQAPAIEASELTAMGRAIELAQHPYCVCDTAANNSSKNISNVNFSYYFEPSVGAELRVLFTNGNTAPNPMLFYSSGSGASWSAPIVLQGATYTWDAGTVVVFVFTDTGARVVGGASNSGGGTVDAANRLTTPRTFRTNLGSTSAANFDGTQNVTMGVTGTLPVARGGTGQSSEAGLKTYLENLIGGGGGGNITKTASGSYVGTGTYGASSPTSITLGFVPKVVFIVANGVFAVLVNGYGDISSLNSMNDGAWAQRNTVTFGATTSWYTNSATQGFQDNEQYNSSGTTYYYVAFE